MQFLDSNESLRRWRAASGPCAFVPTMGALHDGHASLVRQAAGLARTDSLPAGCVVSIFVNPTQFNDPGDLARYPRTLDADLALCHAAGASAVYAPAVHDIYPPGETVETPPLPDVAANPGLEDARRPGHFAGVCQVVLRLLRLVDPAAAVFGEKDWQQLQVITAMAATHHPTTRIIPGPTVREPDGLAMSSRNRFLSPDDRRRGLSLSKALAAAAVSPSVPAAEAAMHAILDAANVVTEYAVVREATSLLPLHPPTASARCRALIAARVGSVRLIDNAPWPAATL